MENKKKKWKALDNKYIFVEILIFDRGLKLNQMPRGWESWEEESCADRSVSKTNVASRTTCVFKSSTCNWYITTKIPQVYTFDLQIGSKCIHNYHWISKYILGELLLLTSLKCFQIRYWNICSIYEMNFQVKLFPCERKRAHKIFTIF